MPATIPTRSYQQREDALAKANQIRVGRSVVKAKLRDGEVTLGEALAAPCCATATISTMLAAQRRWGDRRTNKFLAKLANSYSVPISGARRVKDLTERQLATLLVALGERVQ